MHACTRTLSTHVPVTCQHCRARACIRPEQRKARKCVHRYSNWQFLENIIVRSRIIANGQFRDVALAISEPEITFSYLAKLISRQEGATLRDKPRVAFIAEQHTNRRVFLHKQWLLHFVGRLLLGDRFRDDRHLCDFGLSIDRSVSLDESAASVKVVAYQRRRWSFIGQRDEFFSDENEKKPKMIGTRPTRAESREQLRMNECKAPRLIGDNRAPPANWRRDTYACAMRESCMRWSPNISLILSEIIHVTYFINFGLKLKAIFFLWV